MPKWWLRPLILLDGSPSSPCENLRDWLDEHAVPVLKVWETSTASLYSNLLYRLVSATPPEKPVFVIGCSRTGSTVLFRMLGTSPELKSPLWELNEVWERVCSVNRNSQYASGDALTEEDATPEAKDFVYRNFRLYFGHRRRLDNSPRNAFRIRFLNALFPDAKYVFLYRRGEDVVNSMLNAAQPEFANRFPPRFGTEHLQIPKAPQPGWHFAMPTNWKRLLAKPFNEVCAQIWIQSTESMLRNRDIVPQNRLFELRYEEMVEDPQKTAGRLCNFLGIGYGAPMIRFAADFKPVNHTTPPRKDKWKDEHPREVEEIRRLLQPTMARLGYRDLS